MQNAFNVNLICKKNLNVVIVMILGAIIDVATNPQRYFWHFYTGP